MNSKTIGILTFHRAINYGAILQCYALQEALKNISSYNVKVIDYTPNRFVKLYFNPSRFWRAPTFNQKARLFARWILNFNKTLKRSHKATNLELFIRNNLSLTSKVNINNLEDLNNYIDIFIVGSDQVWSLEMTDYDKTYLLTFVDESKLKISYAASLKTSNDKRTEELLKKYLPKIDAISVRESNTVEYLKEKFNIESTCVLDPTLLLSSQKWIDLVRNKDIQKDNKYILIYIVSQQEQLLDMAFRYAQDNNLNIISLNHLKGRENYTDKSDASIEQFIDLINRAECIFTTSFHGIALSINLHKEFYFETKKISSNNNMRLIDITDKLGLSNRNISNNAISNNIDWKSVEEKLNSLRKESFAFLSSAIGLKNEK